MEIDHQGFRRARTRSLIQLGGLIETTGLLEHFGLMLGADLQKDDDMKQPVSALVGALLELKSILHHEQYPLSLLSEKGMKHLASNRKE